MDNKKIFQSMLGERISSRRMSKGWSQARLAIEIGMSTKHISTIELGKKLPNSYTCTLILLALDMEANELLNEFDKNRYKEDDAYE